MMEFFNALGRLLEVSLITWAGPLQWAATNLGDAPLGFAILFFIYLAVTFLAIFTALGSIAFLLFNYWGLPIRVAAGLLGPASLVLVIPYALVTIAVASALVIGGIWGTVIAMFFLIT